MFLCLLLYQMNSWGIKKSRVLTTCSNEQQTQPSLWWPGSHHRSGTQHSETPDGAENGERIQPHRRSCRRLWRLKTDEDRQESTLVRFTIVITQSFSWHGGLLPLQVRYHTHKQLQWTEQRPETTCLKCNSVSSSPCFIPIPSCPIGSVTPNANKTDKWSRWFTDLGSRNSPQKWLEQLFFSHVSIQGQVIKQW